MYIRYIDHGYPCTNMKNNLPGAAVLLLLAPFALAQNSLRTVERIEQKDNRLEVATSDGTYLITPYSERIMETVFVPKGEARDIRSHAVVMSPAAAGVLKSDGKSVQFSTGGISATISRDDQAARPAPWKATSGASAEALTSATVAGARRLKICKTIEPAPDCSNSCGLRAREHVASDGSDRASAR